MNDDEKKYEDVINTLKSLQQVNAHPNFEVDLKRRLNEGKYARDKKKGFRNLLMPSRLIPSFGLAVAAVIVLMIVNVNSEEADNPFLMEPKIREDIFTLSETDDIQLPEKDLSGEAGGELEERTAEDFDRHEGSDMMLRSSPDEEGLIAGRELSPSETTMTRGTDAIETEELTSQPATGFAIRKSALNFRQVNITEAQQKDIIELKKRISTEQEKAEIK
ncbi:hypothetical protein ACFLSS_02405 [Bacteroidota bacterium]